MAGNKQSSRLLKFPDESEKNILFLHLLIKNRAFSKTKTTFVFQMQQQIQEIKQ
jgi:hypothetical protein